MQVVTVGTKYQSVWPKETRKKVKGIKPGAKLIVYPVDERTVTVKVEEKDWLESTRGIMKDAWKGIDTTAYLNKLRDEWDRK